MAFDCIIYILITFLSEVTQRESMTPSIGLGNITTAFTDSTISLVKVKKY
jgi:hypothetical protein